MESLENKSIQIITHGKQCFFALLIEQLQVVILQLDQQHNPLWRSLNEKSEHFQILVKHKA